MFRAMRRPKASGLPTALSKGCTTTESAPATPAAKPATVVRSMFTQGSRRLVIAADVTALWTWALSEGAAPLAPATRSQQRRAARNLAMVRNWSAVAE